MIGWTVIAVIAALAALLTIACTIGLARQAARLKPDAELNALARPADLATFPPVSAIVPVRNEERNIERCLRSLLALDYPHLEILIADDGSTDRTVEIAKATLAAAPPERARAVRILSTPRGEPGEREGWRSGKAFVLHHAAREARGRWLLFVDCDTSLRPDALWRVVETARRRDLRALSASGVYVNPRFFGEVLETVVYSAIFLTMPLRRINDPADPHMGWMNGQFILFERAAYERTGGHAAIKRYAQDDLALGRLVKERFIPYLFLPGAALYDCVNYVGLGEAYRGWVRLMASGTPWLGFGRRFFRTTIAVVLLVTVAPWIALALALAGVGGGVAPAGLSATALAAGTIALGIAPHALARATMKNPVWRAIFLPVGGLLCAATLRGASRLRFGAGAIDLRGRRLAIDEPRAADFAPQPAAVPERVP